jgi:hypothetical protein
MKPVNISENLQKEIELKYQLAEFAVWRNRPEGVERTKLCPKCSKEISYLSNHCRKCFTYKNWPSIDYILDQLQTRSYVDLAKELNVSDNAIRKHIKRNNLIPPKSRQKIK